MNVKGPHRASFVARSAGRIAIAIAFGSLVAIGASHAAVIVYGGALSGPNESPANNSPGTGLAIVTVDDVANTMRVQVTFSGLQGTTTASHIHCCTATPNTLTAGVATTTPTFAGFPLGVTSGTYDNTLDLTLASSYNPAFVTANGGTPATAEAALLAGMAQQRSYLNIHSSIFGGGEIRSFLAAQVAPTLVKDFTPSSAPLGAPISLTFTLTNPAANVVPLSNVSFTDTLPSGLAIAPGSTSACGGTLTTTANTISLAGGSIAVNGQCQFSVPLTGVAVGTFVNTTGTVSADVAVGATASATLQVLPPPLIPTLQPWLVAVLALLLSAGAFAFARRRRR